MMFRHFITSSPKGNDRSPDNKQVFLNSSQVSKRFFFNWSRAANSAVHGLTKFGCQSRVVTLLQIWKKMMLYNPNVDLVNDNVYTKFGHILSIRSQDIE